MKQTEESPGGLEEALDLSEGLLIKATHFFGIFSREMWHSGFFISYSFVSVTTQNLFLL